MSDKEIELGDRANISSPFEMKEYAEDEADWEDMEMISKSRDQTPSTISSPSKISPVHRPRDEDQIVYKYGTKYINEESGSEVSITPDSIDTHNSNDRDVDEEMEEECWSLYDEDLEVEAEESVIGQLEELDEILNSSIDLEEEHPMAQEIDTVFQRRMCFITMLYFF